MADRFTPSPGLVINSDGTVSFGMPALTRFGQTLVHFPGSDISNVVTVMHGLGAVPTIVLPVADGFSFDPNNICAWSIDNIDDVSFDVRGRTANGAAIGPGDLTLFWLALRAA